MIGSPFTETSTESMRVPGGGIGMDTASSAAAVATVPAVALEEGFELHVDAFAEAADLILADPIHDVDEGMGWPVMKS